MRSTLKKVEKEEDQKSERRVKKKIIIDSEVSTSLLGRERNLQVFDFQLLAAQLYFKGEQRAQLNLTEE